MINLRAYADDSFSEGPDGILVIAGYINASLLWKEFDAAWQVALHKPPGIAYLKMAEANGLRGQFGGWAREKRDAKILDLSNVISQLTPASFHLSLDLGYYRKVVTAFAPRGLGRPHFPAIFATMSMLANGFALSQAKVEIDFVFDNQEGVKTDLAKLYYFMRRNLADCAKKVVPRKPNFGDDKLHLGLQAADLLAWNIRRVRCDISVLTRTEATKMLVNSSQHYYQKFDNTVFDRWASSFRNDPNCSRMQNRNIWSKLINEVNERDFDAYF